MKYAQTRKQSGELLRQIVQTMAGHPASFTPHSYAVWYEHLAAINPALSTAISKLQRDNVLLDDLLIEQLHKKHIAPNQPSTDPELQNKLARLMKQVSTFASQASTETAQFNQSLDRYSQDLHAGIDIDQLEQMIEAMSKDTLRMRESMDSLQGQLQASQREIDKLQSELDVVKAEAFNDPLTGILNRRGFDKIATGIIKAHAKDGKGIYLLMLDIDHFKSINDNYGHPFGDKVLQAVVNQIMGNTTNHDVVARMGGEEFVVLLPGSDQEHALKVAEHIRKHVEQVRVQREQQSISGLTISIGIARYEGELLQAIDQADQALYLSKQGGRNRSTFFKPD